MIPKKVDAHYRLVNLFESEIVTPMVNEMWELYAALLSVITTHNLWSPEGTYTLPDGTTLHKGEDAA